MYHFLDQQIQTLGVEQKWIRHELQGEVHEPKKLPDYPADIPVPETVEITVTIDVYKRQILFASLICLYNSIFTILLHKNCQILYVFFRFFLSKS